MKRNLLKTLLVAAGLLAGTSGTWAQIKELPFTANFDDGTTGVFDGGTVVKANESIGNVLSVVNGTATAYFDIDENEDGYQPYELKDNESVVFNFMAFHGWVSGTGTVSINNSLGESLVSYTYNIGNCYVTDVSIGGVTVTGFTNFLGQSDSNHSRNGANGFGDGSGTQDYQGTDGYNPIVTMSVASDGTVEFNLAYSFKGAERNYSFSGQLPEGKTIDLGSMTIVCTCTNSDRVIGIDNLTITSKTVENSHYILKRVCGDEVLTTENLSIAEGKTLTLPTDNYYDANGKKYIYVSDDSETVGTSDVEGKTYTITYREAAEWTYIVNAVDGSGNQKKVAKTGTNYEGEIFNVGFPAYINVDGTIWKTDKQNGGFYFTLTLDANNKSTDITYTESDITGVVYLEEAENIDGLTLTDNSNTVIRSSNSASAYAKDGDVVITNLESGTYKIGAIFCDASSGNSTWSFKAGETTVCNYQVSQVNFDDGCLSDEFTLYEATDIALAQGGNDKLGVDLIYIQKTGDAKVNVSIDNADGLATYVAPVALDFSNAQNIAAYAAKVDNENATVTLTKVATVAKGEGVLLRSLVEGEDKSVSEDIAWAASTTEANENNDFIAVTEDGVVLEETDGEYTNFVLSKEDGVVGFFKANNTNIAAGKAYLKAKTATVNGAKGLKLVFDGEATGISEVSASKAADNAYYTLSGVRVQQPTKGLYIVNGKKVVIK